jgi:integrase/recombinase XerD
MAGRLGSGAAVPLELSEVGSEPAEQLLERYRWYLLDRRRLDASTVRGYVDRVRPFVVARVSGDRLDLAGVDASDVHAFVLSECRRRSRGSAKLTVTALRSLPRFLQFEGVVSESLAEGVLSVAAWRLAGLPQHLEPGQVDALLSGCDMSTSRGLRDPEAADPAWVAPVRGGAFAAAGHRRARRRVGDPRQA